MSGTKSVAARILAAQARHCDQLAADLAAARAAGASAEVLADIAAQERAARERYQELAVDMPGAQHDLGAGWGSGKRRPWWRIW